MRVLAALASLALVACGGGGNDLSCPDLQAMHRAVNELRTTPRMCGDRLYGAAPALRLSFSLSQAAARHAGDMASAGFVAHTGSDGSSVAARAGAVGYRGSVGENVAGGTLSLEETTVRFAESPGHCANLMNPDAGEVGVACSVGVAPYRMYWVQVFGL